MDPTRRGAGFHQLVAGDSAAAPAVTIVSDVMLYRQGLATSLEREGRLRIIDVVPGVDGLSAISARRPDVVLLDGAMAECLQLARAIRAANPGLRLVGFAISGGAQQIVDCAEAGLTAFVDCNGSVESLVDTTLAALRGELTCSSKVSALLCERLASLSVGSRLSTALTQRESEVAALVGHGLSNKEIANSLNIGSSTVKNHVHNILEKLNIRRRSAIIQRLGESFWAGKGDQAGLPEKFGTAQELTCAD